MGDTYTLVFAKAPVPGRVKTRLIPALGAVGAARLAGRLLDDILGRALAADIGPVELCASPAVTHPDWAGHVLPAGLATSDQGAGDLGARMARAARRHLDTGRRVLLIGTDCPALSVLCLREAAAALDDHQAAMVPARDGGYVLLGLRGFHPSLFADLPWSTAAVADLTLARIAALGWRAWVGAELQDIDEPADLHHLPDHLRLDLPLHTTRDALGCPGPSRRSQRLT
jgi:rSAM/selenodomain-associated transferase 1